MNDRIFQELIDRETKPKHKGFFGKIFDSNEFAKSQKIISLPKFKLFCGVERQDEKGLYIPELSYVWEGHSFLWNWYKQLWSVAFAVDENDGTDWIEGNINYKTQAGNVLSGNVPILVLVTTTNPIPQYAAAASSTTQGIALGIGTDVVQESDFALKTVIAHSTTSADCLNYGVSTGSVTYDSTTKTWQVDYSRLFTGNTNNSVIVNEMALRLVFSTGVKTIGNTCITMRDLVSPAVTINVSPANATFHYILQSIFPA